MHGRPQSTSTDACQLESWVEDGVTIDTLRFNFHAVHLRRVGWRKLSGIHNAVALALLGVAGSRLQVAEERVQVAIAFYRGLLQTVAEPQESSVRALPSAMVLDLADAVLDIQTTDQLRAWLAAH